MYGCANQHLNTISYHSHTAKTERSDHEPITLHFVSRQSGKAAIASVANSTFRTKLRRHPSSSPACDIAESDEPSLAELKLILEGQTLCRSIATDHTHYVQLLQARTASLRQI